MDKKIILVTGAAGFIGYHICSSLIKQGHHVIGLDNITDYYDVNLKYDRIKKLGVLRNEAERFGVLATSTSFGDQFQFIRLNLEDRKELPNLFKRFKFDSVCNLAAQAGVRYSISNPEAYIDSNITGFLNVLECCRSYNITRLVYASSSSIYGNSEAVPFEETAVVDKPISLYAATKKSNELMAHTYSHLYNFETIGLRFFTVYGPWGRPDMAMFLFTDAILKGTRVDGIYNVDPEKDKNAIKFETITFKDVISKGLKVMDMTAFTLSEENKLPIIVFDMNTNGNLLKLVSGKQIGTIVNH